MRHPAAGHAIACGGLPFLPVLVSLENSILRDGGDEVSHDPQNATVTVEWSNIQGGWEGEGNVDADPLFGAGPLGCYYLSQTVATGQPFDSPCVNAGSDYGRKPRAWMN